MPNLFGFLRGKRRCRAGLTTLLVYVDHDRSLDDVYTEVLKALDPLNYSLVDLNALCFL